MCRSGLIFTSRINQPPALQRCEGACRVPIRRLSHDDMFQDSAQLTTLMVNDEFCIKKESVLAQIDQALSVELGKEDIPDDEIALIQQKRAAEHIELRLRALDEKINLATDCQHTQTQHTHENDEGKHRFNATPKTRKGCLRKAKSFHSGDQYSRWAPESSADAPIPARQLRCSLQHSVIIDESRNVTMYYDDSPLRPHDSLKYSQTKKYPNSQQNGHQIHKGQTNDSYNHTSKLTQDSRWAA